MNEVGGVAKVRSVKKNCCVAESVLPLDKNAKQIKHQWNVQKLPVNIGSHIGTIPIPLLCWRYLHNDTVISMDTASGTQSATGISARGKWRSVRSPCIKMHTAV